MIKDDEILTKTYFKSELKKEFGSALANFVTKDYFKSELKKELSSELSNYVTKDYFKTELKRELSSALTNYVTKDYFKSELKKELSNYVTKKYLKSELDKQTRIIKTDIIREVRIMMHETMESGMENMKLYYQEETNRHMTALLQGFKDEMLVYNDQFKSFMDKLGDHEQRITVLERF